MKLNWQIEKLSFLLVGSNGWPIKHDQITFKHRGHILFISALMYIIDPASIITIGKLPITGFGFEIKPPIELSIGWLLFFLLVYRVAGFWSSILITIRTQRGVPVKIDPPSFRERTSLWLTYKVLWEFVFPTFCAVGMASYYLFHIILKGIQNGL